MDKSVVRYLHRLLLDPQKAPQFHKRIGENYFDKVLQPAALNASRLVIASYKADELFDGKSRSELQDKILQLLKKPEVQIEVSLSTSYRSTLPLPSRFPKQIEEAEIETQKYKVETQRAQVIKQEDENSVARPR